MTTGRDPRWVEWLLDRDGDIYGDERERIRWYEAIAVASSLQTFGVPWALAVTVWITDSRAVAGALLAVALTFYLPLMWTASYVQRRGVRVYGKAMTAKRIVTTALFVVPYGLFFLGILDAFAGLGSSAATGAWIGGAVGLVVALVTARVHKRRAALRESTPEDLD